MKEASEYRATPGSGLLVSVIIPTRNRVAVLQEQIEALWKQSLDPEAFEVIVVDNCSDDDTAAMIEACQKTSPCPLFYHRMPDNAGPVRSRNTGARLARSGILAFTDSDCRVHPKWLETALAAFTAEPDLAFVTGPVVDKPEQRVRFFSLRFDIAPGEDPTYRACNVFYRAAIFWSMGGFDESAYFGEARFQFYECSDVDLAWKIKEKGGKNKFLDDLIVYHEVWTVSPVKWLEKHTGWAVLPIFLKRHPNAAPAFLWHEPLCVPQNALFYLLCLGVLLGLAVDWRAFLLSLPYLIWLLRRMGVRNLWHRPLTTVAQLGLLSMAQAAMCGSLLYGSIRARKLVL